MKYFIAFCITLISSVGCTKGVKSISEVRALLEGGHYSDIDAIMLSDNRRERHSVIVAIAERSNNDERAFKRLCYLLIFSDEHDVPAHSSAYLLLDAAHKQKFREITKTFALEFGKAGNSKENGILDIPLKL